MREKTLIINKKVKCYHYIFYYNIEGSEQSHAKKKLTTWMQLQCEGYILLESHISNNETAVKRFFSQ